MGFGIKYYVYSILRAPTLIAARGRKVMADDAS